MVGDTLDNTLGKIKQAKPDDQSHDGQGVGGGGGRLCCWLSSPCDDPKYHREGEGSQATPRGGRRVRFLSPGRNRLTWKDQFDVGAVSVDAVSSRVSWQVGVVWTNLFRSELASQGLSRKGSLLCIGSERDGTELESAQGEGRRRSAEVSGIEV